MTVLFEETKELLDIAISQLRKAKYRLDRGLGPRDARSVKALLKNAQRVNRAAQRTFRKENQ